MNAAEKKAVAEPDGKTKGDSIRLRVTKVQKEILTRASTEAGLSLSSWLLSVGLREAKKAGIG
jgi:uncharacterized protein (DUF1778 family)